MGRFDKYLNEEITREEAVELFKVKGTELMELFSVANKIREKYCGNTIHTCTITNAKSGKCSEDCKFCAQSAYYETGIDTYEMKECNLITDEYNKSCEIGSDKFGVVTSGKAVEKGSSEYKTLLEFLDRAKGLSEPCFSTGKLTYEEAVELKSMGLTRFHNNIQTSVESYSDIVATTHTVYDRIEAIKNAKKAGLEVCCGGIIGMGESHEDRVSMAFTIKELDVECMPLNILNPIKGTPYGEKNILDINEILKTIAIYRIILRDKVLKITAGRESILKDFMGLAFMSGANSLMVGGYLTVRGRSVEEDKKFIEDIKKMWGE
jgi:biotin synthase